MPGMTSLGYSTADTHAPVSVPCMVESIFICGGTMGQIDIYDAVNDDTGTALLTIAAPFPGMTIPRFRCETGLTLKLAEATIVLVTAVQAGS